ncbi:Regulator of G-protein signaling 20 [Cichlidogyrus casuarinus]|uniref:Regulator of G-protein signaling 20 n=1 Tax=Cichlidogyrus casuarinus TaxID=1844966 RepID=A0ABD2PQH8_9PLAT
MSNFGFSSAAPVKDSGTKGPRSMAPGHQTGGLSDSNSFQMNAYSNSNRLGNNTQSGGGGGGAQNSENTPLTQQGDMIANDLQMSANQGNNGTAGSNGSIANGDPRTRTCCFCWCCCCSCSCMQVRPNLDENKRNSPSNDMQNKINDPFSKEEHLPTYEELRKWGESFDALMLSGYGQKIFKEFLRSEYSDENIMFWLACEDLKQTTNADDVEEKAHNIYEDFISMLSPKEVSLDSRVREIIDANMMEPSPHTFDEAQLQIYTLMHRDSYPRFLNSRIYKDLLNDVTGTQA